MAEDTRELEADHARHTALGTFQDLIGSGLVLPTGILTAAFLTRQLGPRDYGLLAVAAAIVVWVELVVTIGPGRTAEKYVAAEDRWRAIASSLLRGQILLAIGVAALLAVASGPIATHVGTPELAGYLLLFSLDIPLFATHSILKSVLIGRGRFGSRAFLSGAFWVVRLILILLCVGLYPSVSAAIVATLGASLVVVVAAFIKVPVGPFQRAPIPWKNLAGFAGPVVLYSIGLALFSRMDLILVEAFGGGSADSGFYGAALNLAVVPPLIASASAPLLVAKLSFLDAAGMHATARSIAGSALRAPLLLLPFAGATAGLSSELVTIIYGRAFEPAAPLLALLIFAGVGLTLAAVAGESLIGSGCPGRSVALSLPFVVVAALAHLVVIPAWGPIGAASVTTLTAWLIAAAMVVGLVTVRNLRPPISSMLWCALVAALVWWVGSTWLVSGGMVFVKLIVVPALAVVGLVLTGELGAVEIDFLISMVRPRRRASSTEVDAVLSSEWRDSGLGWRESYRDADVTFYIGCYRDADAVEETLSSVRNAFSGSRVILISDGDADPRFGQLAERFDVDYRAGERLMGVEHGGHLVQRMLLAFLERPTAYLIKIDTDTRVHRRFRRLPEGRVVFGTLEWQTAVFRQPLAFPSVQGGCIGFSLAAARELAQSEIFTSSALLDAPASWADAFDLKYRAERYGLIADDFMTRYGCRALDVQLVDFPEVFSIWRGAIPSGHDYAVTHPHGGSKGRFFPYLLRAQALPWAVKSGISRLLGDQ